MLQTKASEDTVPTSNASKIKRNSYSLFRVIDIQQPKQRFHFLPSARRALFRGHNHEYRPAPPNQCVEDNRYTQKKRNTNEKEVVFSAKQLLAHEGKPRPTKTSSVLSQLHRLLVAVTITLAAGRSL